MPNDDSSTEFVWVVPYNLRNRLLGMIVWSYAEKAQAVLRPSCTTGD